MLANLLPGVLGSHSSVKGKAMSIKDHQTNDKISKDILESLTVVNDNLMKLKEDLNLIKKRHKRPDLADAEEFKTMDDSSKRFKQSQNTLTKERLN